MLGNVKKILSDWRNFSEIFRKDKTYGNIKSHKKHGFTLSLEDLFFEKPTRRCQIDPSQLFLG